jgi:hypothetical protein
MSAPKIVAIDTRTVGAHFATIGIVRRRTGRKVRIIYRGIERPYGFVDAALRDAREWAEAQGYRIEVEP